jgi:hypothetical protein
MLQLLLIGGVAGWALENFAFGPRYSKWLGGAAVGVPFLPVYAVGGVVLGLLAPRLAQRGWWTRAAMYGASFGALEWVACQVDRTDGRPQWSYGDGACVDLPHVAAWAALGLVAEKVRG